MKTVVVLATILSVALAVPYYLPSEDELFTADIGPNITYLLVEDEQQPGHYVIEDIQNGEITVRAAEADVTYYYHSQNNVNNGVPIKSDNIFELSNTDFSSSRDTVCIIHGWRNSYTSDVNVLVRQAILSRHDVNVFVVDWSPIASQDYISAQSQVREIGEYVGKFLDSLNGFLGLDLSRVTLIGHSLGAHVSGNAGAALNNQISRIVGLDPALPRFSIGDITNRLDPTDAKFVQVIHSCGRLLGFFAPIGHVDYYPNGGTFPQPGCGFDVTTSCAHSRSYVYYAESVAPVSSNSFVSKQCRSYSDYSNGRCDSNPRSDLGGYPVGTGATGTYFLNTNSKPPFAQG